MKLQPLKFNNGDKIDKVAGTVERFQGGRILSVFKVRSGMIRYVAEAPSGELFICSDKCLIKHRAP